MTLRERGEPPTHKPGPQEALREKDPFQKLPEAGEALQGILREAASGDSSPGGLGASPRPRRTRDPQKRRQGHP